MNNYNDKNIAIMELIYGEGYLSTGGDQEVARIFKNVKTDQAVVLDVGCGLGGAVVALAKYHNANDYRSRTRKTPCRLCVYLFFQSTYNHLQSGTNQMYMAFPAVLVLAKYRVTRG